MIVHGDSIVARRREPAAVWRALVAVLAVLLATGAKADSDWTLVEEHWFILEVDEQTAGWMSSFVHQKDDLLRGTSSMIVAIDRASVGTGMEIHTEFIESRAGQPVSMKARHVMSQQPVETLYRFEQDRVIEVSRQGGREMTREHPHPEGKWLTPRAARRFKIERLAAGAEEIAYRALDPTRGLAPVTVTSRRDGEATYEHDGRSVPVTVWLTVSEDTGPLEAIEHYTIDGYLVYQKFTTGLGEFVMRRVSREEAEAAKGAPAPELFARTVITPDRPIRNVMRTRTLRMRVSAKVGELPELPSAGAQRVTMADDRSSAVLDVDLNNPLDATDEELANEEYVTATPLIDSEDALVRALSRRALRALPEAQRQRPRARAEILRSFVYEYITDKSLDTAFASASETARTRRGDCTEHAVLLTAMLRADGIPARIATGLVYVDEAVGETGVFGWHMWTQALIDGKWLDLDATLPVAVPYHAGHITTGVARDGEGGMSENTAMILMIGNLEIEILGDPE